MCVSLKVFFLSEKSVKFVPQTAFESDSALTPGERRVSLQVFQVLFNGAVKYDDLYACLISLLSAGSQFDAARRQENKAVTPMVRDSNPAFPSARSPKVMSWHMLKSMKGLL